MLNFMLNVLIPLVTSLIANCLIVPTMTYFLNRRLRKVANSELDILNAISILKDDVHSADSELAVISRDIFNFVHSGTELDKADKSVFNIKYSKEATSYTLYDDERPEVKELCSLLDAERRKLVK